VRYVVRAQAPTTALGVDFDDTLNDEQRRVVTAPDGAALVIAGAGSGKTRALTYRVAWLIARGIAPERILLCTFTNRAAREMVRRVAELCGLPPSGARALWAGTFHHVAHLALRRFGGALGLPERYAILDREDARELCAACLADEGATKLAERRLPQAQVLLSLFSLAANLQLPLAEAVLQRAPRFGDTLDVITRVAERYARRKAELALLDFDDLLLFWKLLLSDHPAAARALRERFQHVLVDEYQDTNPLQAELCDLLVGGHGNLMVVGDDAQSIYSFRGADVNNMLEFARRHPEARTFRLETNYRSTPEILALANRSIAHNRRQLAKQLRAVRPAGPRPALVPLRDVYLQAAFVAQRLLELSQEQGVPLGELAVLYRNHGHSLELQVELARRKIPYVVRSGLRFFEQAHIKDVLAYLRVVHNGRDELAWGRILRLYRGVGEVAARRMAEAARAEGSHLALGAEALVRALPASARSAAARLQALLDELAAAPAEPGPLIRRVVAAHYADYARAAFTNAEVRLVDLEQLAAFAARQGELADFLAELALTASVAAEGVVPGERPDDHLVLSTIHQAKGLEWRAVFVLWLADGRFPQSTSLGTEAQEEEERRLFYVAATRARDELYLCSPRMGETREGSPIILRASRFIEEVELGSATLVDRWQIEEEAAS
jgi:DNA helicase-2/ATP-dependent DNA helicase PcrA